MNMKGKISILISFVLIGILSLLVLTGCSRLRDFVKRTPSLNSQERIYGLKDKDVAKFVGKIRFYQENPDSIYQRARYFQERKKHKLAVQEFQRVTHIDPGHAKAFNGMGVSYDHMGQFDLAMECYYKALAINPHLDYVQNNLGYSFLLQGDVDNAVAALKKAIALNGKNKRYHNNLGLAYAEKGLHDLAFQEFKLAGGSLKAREAIKEKSADSLRRGFGGKAGSGRESSGNADLVEAVESYSSVEETPSVNNSRAQISAYTLTIDSQIPTLDKIEKDSRYEELGAITDQGSSHPSLDRIFIVGQRDDCNVEIEISNGNGVRHMARRVGGYLKEKGYKVTRLTNAQHFQFVDTTIYYCSGHLQDAYKVAREMPGWNEMIKVANLGRPSIKVKVLIAKDLVVYGSLFGGKGLDGDFPRPLKIANLRRDGR